MRGSGTINWQKAISSGEKARTTFGKDKRWKDLERYYENDFGLGAEKLPSFNILYIMGRSLLPTVIFHSPGIINTPRRPEFVAWASLFDTVDNFLVTETALEETYKEACLHAFLYGTGCVIDGWDFLPFTPSGDGTLSDVILSRTGFREVPGVVDSARRVNFPWVSADLPEKIVFSSEARFLRNSRFLARKMCLYLDDVKKMDFTGASEIKATHTAISDPGSVTNVPSSNDEGDELVEFYEVHDAINKTVGWVAGDGTVIRDFE